VVASPWLLLPWLVFVFLPSIVPLPPPLQLIASDLGHSCSANRVTPAAAAAAAKRALMPVLLMLLCVRWC